jgi:hypothetical protein
MREVGAATYPDIEFTHYQCLRSYDSRGEKGGMYSHVDENVFTHATSGIHESAHNFLNRRHSGVYGSGPSGAYNDYLGSVLASSAQGWRRLGLNVADRVRGRLITATNYTGPGIYRIGRLEAHPASRVDGEIAALMLPRGTHNLPLYLSPRKTKACPYPLPAAFDDTLFVHEIEPDGQSWRHPMLKPGTHELINGMSINFTGIEDECAVVEVLA